MLFGIIKQSILVICNNLFEQKIETNAVVRNLHEKKLCYERNSIQIRIRKKNWVY